MGITVIFASGDSGSGYQPTEPVCYGPEADIKNNTVLVGEILSSEPSSNYQQCCSNAPERNASGKAWTWTAPGSQPWPICSALKTPSDKAYTGGQVLYDLRTKDAETCCGYATGYDHWYFSFIPGQSPEPGNCTIYLTVDGEKSSPGAFNGKPSSASLLGVCTYFSSVTGSRPQEGSLSMAPQSNLPKLWPSWPASSPYITAVGATRFVGQTVGNAEMATDQFGSGGGFSKQFGQSPDAKWQIEAVQHYVNNPPKDQHYPPAGSFPTDGRATPDVSALGEGYQVLVDGEVQSIGGTSASAPAFAGLVALLNDARMQHGKKQMGFLNPFLYQNADCFTDVVLGTNAVGRGDGPIKYGFNATKGWDPATGLGTPIFSKLLAAALNATDI